MPVAVRLRPYGGTSDTHRFCYAYWENRYSGKFLIPKQQQLRARRNQIEKQESDLNKTAVSVFNTYLAVKFIYTLLLLYSLLMCYNYQR